MAKRADMVSRYAPMNEALFPALGDKGDTPFPYWTVNNYVIKDTVASAAIDIALVSNAVAWFYEVIVWNANPVAPNEKMPGGGWFAVDMTDSPAETMLP